MEWKGGTCDYRMGVGMSFVWYGKSRVIFRSFRSIEGWLGQVGILLGFNCGIRVLGRRGNKVGLGKDIFLAEEGCIVVKLNV